MSEENCTHDCSSCSESCSARQPSREELLAPMNSDSTIRKVIGVISGKGGVGKSFVTSFMASQMKKRSYSTAVLDADITGPSIPRCFGVHEKALGSELGILPAETKSGIELMSINLLLENEESPVIWRGPVLAGVIKQFWSEVVWGSVDYMFVDMPPGTGDVALTVFQSLPIDGLIIVTSPQDLVSMIVAKAVNMANAMNIPILGLVENYSYMECEKCGERQSLFGVSHVDETAQKFGLRVLAKLPMNSAIARAMDEGTVEELEGGWLDDAADFIEKTFMD